MIPTRLNLRIYVSSRVLWAYLCIYRGSTVQRSVQCVIDGNKDSIVKASVDNQEIKNIDRYRVTTDLFNVTYSNDPVTPTNSNVSQAVSDGWFVFLEPLKAGKHEIKFIASQLSGENAAEPAALIDVT